MVGLDTTGETVIPRIVMPSCRTEDQCISEYYRSEESTDCDLVIYSDITLCTRKGTTFCREISENEEPGIKGELVVECEWEGEGGVRVRSEIDVVRCTASNESVVDRVENL